MDDYDLLSGWVACRAAIELDNYRLGRNTDLTHFNQIRSSLEANQLASDSQVNIGSGFPYFALKRVAERDSAKPKIRCASELALEMRLMRYVLDSGLEKPENLPQAVSLLCDISHEFQVEDCKRHPRRYSLVA